MKKKTYIIIIIVFAILTFLMVHIVKKQDLKINLSNVKYGDEITFGNYKGEKIKWIVLDDFYALKGTILLISKNIIDVRPLNEKKESVSWQDSTFNKWLNNEFINSVFENSVIDNIVINTESDEIDKITILSSLQLELNLLTNEDRKVTGTSYAYNNGLDGYEWYWTKSICKKDDKAYEAVNGDEGWIRTGGMFVNSTNIGLRPAFWIKKNTIIDMFF